MSLLLTDEAINAAVRNGERIDGEWIGPSTLLHDFLRFHATEGRKTLVEKIAFATMEAQNAAHVAEHPGDEPLAWGEDEGDTADYLAGAEIVVTALFGEGGDAR